MLSLKDLDMSRSIAVDDLLYGFIWSGVLLVAYFALDVSFEIGAIVSIAIHYFVFLFDKDGPGASSPTALVAASQTSRRNSVVIIPQNIVGGSGHQARDELRIVWQSDLFPQQDCRSGFLRYPLAAPDRLPFASFVTLFQQHRPGSARVRLRVRQRISARALLPTVSGRHWISALRLGVDEIFPKGNSEYPHRDMYLDFRL